ncbi:uncharacterized protein LOC121856404 isoform X3 [Homarus americanus]|uniref:uncharacterized protein LOC121856404 isoform X3 n=1 Tax=Homarus americanus TaxID=6706 RepID=UPI001C4826D7|nr:uncharacterized protein LOC121856404 isoform X3 [Homarus americanus]
MRCIMKVQRVVERGVWCVVVTAAVLMVVTVAAPHQDTKTQNVKKSFPAQLGGLDEEVRQLLDLKGYTGHRDLDLFKGQVKEQQRVGADGGAKVKDHQVTTNGELLSHTASDLDRHQEQGQPQHTRQKIQLDIPSEDIHDTIVDEDGRRTLLHGDQKGPRVRYTPLDLAVYVYKTGDEEGVTLAIQELIAEGLMTAEEALSYLHDIRNHLRYLNQQDDEDEKVSQNDFKSMIKKNSLPLPLTEMNVGGDPEGMMTPDLDYENLLEKLRGQDYAYTEYSLEEVIYQLAKILFKQAMHREGDIGSEKTMQEVAALLEKEAARGVITPEVEKKVLDVMVNSLVDSISENEFQVAPGPMIGGSNFKVANESPFPLGNSPMIGGSNFKVSNESPFSLGSSSLIGGSDFKPTNELFQLSKATAKREVTEDDKEEKKKVEDKKD